MRFTRKDVYKRQDLLCGVDMAGPSESRLGVSPAVMAASKMFPEAGLELREYSAEW